MPSSRCRCLLAIVAALFVTSALVMRGPSVALTPPLSSPFEESTSAEVPMPKIATAPAPPVANAVLEARPPLPPFPSTANSPVATGSAVAEVSPVPTDAASTTANSVDATTASVAVPTATNHGLSMTKSLSDRIAAAPAAPSSTPKPLPVDRLGAHPLESSFVQGHEDPHVRALARVMTPLVSHGYYYGFVSLGGGDAFSVKSRAKFDGPQEPRSVTAPGAIHAAQKAVKQFSNGSIVIMWMGDTSPFCYADAREIIAKLNAGQGFGRLWWLTYNPCILDAAGRIGEYEIPIPSFDLMTYNDLGLETRKFPMSERSRKVVWRGQTTGVGDDGDYRYNRWGNYRTCHRYKVVESFNRFAEAHPEVEFDVKFTGNDINSQGMVPAAYWGNYTKSSTVSAQIQLDVDGNGISWLGVRRKLGSGSVVMRAFSNMTQFYFPWLKNGTHILVYNTTDELAAAAHHLLRAPQSEATREWMTNITRRAAEIADQLATGAMLDGYLYGRIVNATSEYDADKDWRIRR